VVRGPLFSGMAVDLLSGMGDWRRPPHSGKPTLDQNSAPKQWDNNHVGLGQMVTGAVHHTQGSQLETRTPTQLLDSGKKVTWDRGRV
jgi:hypothetical protein